MNVRLTGWLSGFRRFGRGAVGATLAIALLLLGAPGIAHAGIYATVTGTVTSLGQPVAGAEVCLLPDQEYCDYSTGSDGRYSIQVPPGEVQLKATWDENDDGTQLTATSDTFTAQDGGTYDNVDLVLSGGTGIAGSVTFSGGGERDGVVKVFRVGPGGTETQASRRSFEGPSPIRYAFRELSPGTYVLRYSFAGYESQCFGGTTCTQVSVTDGEITSVSDVELVPLAPGSVSGLVVDSSGSPLAGVSVTAQLDSDPSTTSSTVTGTDGTFSLAGLSSGLGWDVRFEKKDYGSTDSWVVPVAGANTALGVVHLALSSTVTGRVVDTSGAGVAGVSVSLEGNTDVSATTASDGTYSFTGVPAGRYRLYAWAPDSTWRSSYYPGVRYWADATRIGVPEDSTVHLTNFTMTKPVAISGRVTDSGGQALGDVLVTLYDEQGDDVATTHTTGSGDYTFADEWPGTYTVGAYLLNYRRTWLPSAASLGDATWLDATRDVATGTTIVMPKLAGGPVSGTLLDAEGNPVVSGTVQLDGSGSRTYSAAVDASGIFSLSFVASGTYRVGVYGDADCGEAGTPCAPVTVSVPASGVSGLTVRLPRTGIISGRVTVPAGFDVAETSLNLYSADGETWIDSVGIGSAGTYAFSVGYGTYRLEADSDEDGLDPASATVVVDSPSITKNLTLTARAMHSISGTITLPQAEDWAEVYVFDASTGDLVDDDYLEDVGQGTIHYEVPGLADGTYVVGLSTRGESVFYPAASTPEAATKVPLSGADVSDIDFSLTATPLVSGALSLPDGVLPGESGYPGIEFTNIDTDGGRWVDVADDGSYQVHLPKGTYSVAIDSDDSLGTAPFTGRVTVTGNTTADFALRVGGWLGGRLVDTDGVPLGDGEVAVTLADGTKVDGDVDPLGYWAVGPLPAGSFHFTAAAEGYRSSSSASAYTVTEGNRTDTGTTQLSGAGELRVYVNELTGSPSVTIVATDLSGTELQRTKAWADGDDYTLNGLPAGPVLVRFEGSRITPQWWRNASTRADATQVSLSADHAVTIYPRLGLATLQPGGVSGTVTNATGHDGVVRVTAISTEDGSTHVVQAGASGAYSVAGLDPGTYTVRGSVCVGYWMGDSGCMGAKIVAWYGGSSADTASVVTVAAGATTTGIDLTVTNLTRFTTVGTASLTGTVKVGNTISVDTGTWSPAASSFTYQWLRDGLAITGASSASYTVGIEDAARAVSVKVTAHLDGYAETSVLSASAIVPKPTLPTGTVALSSTTATVGTPLTATPAGWLDGVSFTYQWLRNGTAIAGATASSYVPTSADVGARISVKVSCRKDPYVGGSVTSAETAAVVVAAVPIQNFTSAPTPTIAGAAKIGATLTAVPGAWAPAPDGLAVQWLRGGVAIPGATATTYKVGATDAGLRLSVQVTASKAGYSPLVRASAPTAAVPYLGKTTAATPKISGTAKVGKTLKAKPGTWKPKGFGFTYQWYRSGVAISGAKKASYKLTSADKRSKIVVKVTGSKAGYPSVTKTSKATGKVK